MLDRLYPYNLVCINSFIKQLSAHCIPGSVWGVEGAGKGRIYEFTIIWTDASQKRILKWPKTFKISTSEVAQSCPTLCDPMNVAYEALPSMGFSRQEYWSGLPFPSPGDLHDPGIKPRSPALQADTLPSELPGKPLKTSKDCVYTSSLDGLNLKNT